MAISWLGIAAGLLLGAVGTAQTNEQTQEDALATEVQNRAVAAGELAKRDTLEKSQPGITFASLVYPIWYSGSGEPKPESAEAQLERAQTLAESHAESALLGELVKDFQQDPSSIPGVEKAASPGSSSVLGVPGPGAGQGTTTV